MAEGLHVRVYHEDLIENFPAVWEDDHALATWLRLLVIADKRWPSPAELPRSVRPSVLRFLVEQGVIELIGAHRYSVRGHAKERTRRAESARKGALTRWGTQSERNANALQTQSDRNAYARTRAVSASASVSVSNGVEGSGEVGVSEDEAEVFGFLAQHGASIREDSGFGRRLLALMGRRTPQRVLETAWDMFRAKGKLSDRQWVLGLENRLEPIEDGKEAAKAERAAELERQSQRGFEATQRYIAELRAAGKAATT